MKSAKYILIIMLTLAFTVNVVASTALAACNCADMANMEQPCHDMTGTEQNSDTDKQNTAGCSDCGCGGCKTPSQTTLLGKSAPSNAIIGSQALMQTGTIGLSKAIFGIDFPPKHIS